MVAEKNNFSSIFFKCMRQFCRDNFAKSKVISKCKNDKPLKN